MKYEHRFLNTLQQLLIESLFYTSEYFQAVFDDRHSGAIRRCFAALFHSIVPSCPPCLVPHRLPTGGRGSVVRDLVLFHGGPDQPVDSRAEVDTVHVVVDVDGIKVHG